MVLSVILGWDVTLTSLAICLPAVVYTILGGVQAVTWTDVKVMGLTVFVLLAAVVVLVLELPAGTGVGDALHLAGATGRLDAFNFEFTLTETYTLWSGLLGGLFLMLSYFGCDQSQVQRYLTARSVDEGRSSLLMSAYWKIPLQVLVLVVGILTFVFYVFHPPPMLFNPVHERRRARERRSRREYRALEQQFSAAFARPAAVRRRAGRRRRRGRHRGTRARPKRRSGQDDAAMKAVRQRATDARQAGDRRRALRRRELRLPDLHHDGAADRAGRACGSSPSSRRRPTPLPPS